MKKVLIIGATSKIAKWVIQELYKNETIALTLFLRNPAKLNGKFQEQKILVGDALNLKDVTNAVQDQDIVYASLSGDVVNAARVIVTAMQAAKVNRLIWTSSLGIYNEIPGEFGRWNQQIMKDYFAKYKSAADIIDQSDLEYTIVRPAWLTDLNEVCYELTHKEEPFKGTEVSRKSVGSYIVSIIEHPDKNVRDSLGIDKPGTNGDRPRETVMLANGGYEPTDKEKIKLRF